MKVEKYHGCHNTFLITSKLPDNVNELCRIHQADGLILAHHHPLSMRIFNRDGSEASMCGNGLRCYVHYAYDRGWIREHQKIVVNTADGQKMAELLSADPVVIRAEIGIPDFTSDRICTHPFQTGLVHAPKLDPSCSASFHMGVPHTVIFSQPDEQLARQLQQDDFFLDGTNVDFAFFSEDHLEIRTWERGVGWTECCGSGSCAVAALAMMFGLVSLPCVIHSEGGKLLVEREENGSYFITGPSCREGQVC